jgi:hypothetical protein
VFCYEFIRVSLLAAACLSVVGVASADAAATSAPLDLGLPHVRSVSTSDPITASAGFKQPEYVSVSGALLPLERVSYLHVSQSGIGSLYWAFHHRGEVWRAVMPVTPDDGPAVSEDLRVK